MKIESLSVIAPSHYPNEHWSEAEVLGSLIWLWQYVDDLKDAPLRYFISRVMPCIEFRQFALFIENNRVIGYISWAYLSEETESDYIQNQGRALPMDDWKSGSRLWIIDWFTPFGHSQPLKEILSTHLFPLTCMRSLYHRGQEKGLRVMSFKGKNITLQEFQSWQAYYPVHYA